MTDALYEFESKFVITQFVAYYEKQNRKYRKRQVFIYQLSPSLALRQILFLMSLQRLVQSHLDPGPKITVVPEL